MGLMKLMENRPAQRWICTAYYAAIGDVLPDTVSLLASLRDFHNGVPQDL